MSESNNILAASGSLNRLLACRHSPPLRSAQDSLTGSGSHAITRSSEPEGKGHGEPGPAPVAEEEDLACYLANPER